MTIQTRLMIGAVAITLTVVAIANATPIVGLLVATILSSGSTNDDTMRKVRVALPPPVGETEEDEWTAKLSTSGPSDFIVQDVVYSPGGHTGWLSPGHPSEQRHRRVDRVVRLGMREACIQRG